MHLFDSQSTRPKIGAWNGRGTRFRELAARDFGVRYTGLHHLGHGPT